MRDARCAAKRLQRRCRRQCQCRHTRLAQQKQAIAHTALVRRDAVRDRVVVQCGLQQRRGVNREPCIPCTHDARRGEQPVLGRPNCFSHAQVITGKLGRIGAKRGVPDGPRRPCAPVARSHSCARARGARRAVVNVGGTTCGIRAGRYMVQRGRRDEGQKAGGAGSRGAGAQQGAERAWWRTQAAHRDIPPAS